MPKLKRLIQGQDVAFDTHQSGDGQETHAEDLHLEKRLHSGGKIRFPLHGSASPSRSRSVSEDKYHRVVAEVRRALDKDPELVSDLAKEIVAQMNRFRQGLATEQLIREAANKIASAFDLGPALAEQATLEASGRVKQFSTLHLGSRVGTAFRVTQSARGAVVERARREWEPKSLGKTQERY